jgi:hypothetical protein
MSTVSREEPGGLVVPCLDPTQEPSTPYNDLVARVDALLTRLGNPDGRPQPVDQLLGRAKMESTLARDKLALDSQPLTRLSVLG